MEQRAWAARRALIRHASPIRPRATTHTDLQTREANFAGDLNPVLNSHHQTVLSMHYKIVNRNAERNTQRIIIQLGGAEYRLIVYMYVGHARSPSCNKSFCPLTISLTNVTRYNSLSNLDLENALEKHTSRSPVPNLALDILYGHFGPKIDWSI